MNNIKINEIKNIKKHLININCKFETATKKFNFLKKKILLVHDSKNRFIGTITLGDFRKSLLIYKSTKIDIAKVLNRKSKVLKNHKNKISSKYLEKLSEKIKFLPVINDGKIIKLIEVVAKEKKILKKIPVIVMAGGLGTRMLPKTKYLPKPMIRINGKPMLENLIFHFKKYNFYKFYFSVNYLKEKIINYFKDGRKQKIDISYLIENKKLGTAGSLSLLNVDEIESDNIIVINCDIGTDFNINDLIEYHNNLKSDFTIVSKPIEEKLSYGELITKGSRVLNINEKKSYEIFINCGIYLIKKDCLKILKKNKYLDMNSFISNLVKKKYKIFKFPIIENWKDLGLK